MRPAMPFSFPPAMPSGEPHPDCPAAAGAGPYRSFWMGGFEGADHVNGRGEALDMATASGHRQRLSEDYAAAASLGLLTVRESAGWRLCEPTAGHHCLAPLLQTARVAREHGVQVVWTLMHYGLPPDLSLFDDRMIERFARFAGAVARALHPWCDEPPVYNPINEIGFLAWAASQTRLLADHAGGPDDPPAEETLHSGYALKRRLVRAALAAMQAIREVEPSARFLHIEPLVHVVPPADHPELAGLAEQVAGYQWQVWDLLAGRLEPELGGHEEALDLIGVNHYHSGQWEVMTEQRLHWAAGDPRRRPFRHLLQDAHQRYGRPLLVAETSHVGEGRAAWLEEMAAEVSQARSAGVPVHGLCLYPLIDRPDWNDPERWHRSGLFDVIPGGQPGPAAERPPPLRRQLHPPYAAALARWQRRLPAPTCPLALEKAFMLPTLIVFSHLRWGFVYQRPQQIMSRLAQHYRVIFVEEPLHADGDAQLVRSRPAPGVEVLCLHTPLSAPGFHDDHLPLLQPLLSEFVRAEGITAPVAWLYTPMALPLLSAVQPAQLVYDCMDELAAFQHAPRQLRQRETALMKTADIVLTGGPSLYEARKGLHPRLHCMPSAVDEAHFSAARLLPDCGEARAAQTLQAGVGHPRMGFFGVIDERMDLDLLAALADARPQWQFVLAGPVVKILPQSLPRRPNLHWLGMQPYAVLPYLVASWDVCLLPFALNESTRFISPTKTLEYMAADKPVVSTAVRDVKGLYGDCVCIAEDVAGFVAGCEAALNESPRERAERSARMATTVWRMSWDATVAAILRLLASPTIAPLHGGLPEEPAAQFGT